MKAEYTYARLFQAYPYSDARLTKRRIEQVDSEITQTLGDMLRVGFAASSPEETCGEIYEPR